jgi:hypothetical protein
LAFRAPLVGAANAREVHIVHIICLNFSFKMHAHVQTQEPGTAK